MESAAIVQGVPFRKKLRIGQLRVFEALAEHQECLNVKLPTGYGKTLTCCGVYSILQRQRRATRLLVIFPTDAQLEQFKDGGPEDLEIAGVDGPRAVIDIRYFGAGALKEHRKNSAQVFAITVQSLQNSRGMNNCMDMMQTGQWMVCVDEYHHYGIDKSWGKAALALPRSFLLAMSATPSRPGDDSAFGAPNVAISYIDAKDERAVKPLRGHSYNYKIDAVNEDGDLICFTTRELAEAAGGDNPEQIERFKIERKMRWSPKYVSPLVSIPIERMQRERIATGFRLQALVGAMCVSHASLVCEQLRSMFPELDIDWVGTGTHGRSPEENRRVLKRFCPPKVDGRRVPTMDVLVHVGMAGEGLDSTFVSEVVHLNNASICNRSNQINGRASRYLEGVVGNINFDASSEFASEGYIGTAVMAAMDLDVAGAEKGEEQEPSDVKDLPEEPTIRIFDMELIGVDSGDPEVQRMAQVLRRSDVRGIDYDEIATNRNHPDWQRVTELYRTMRSVEAESHNRQATVAQWKDAVEGAVSNVTGAIVSIMRRNGIRIQQAAVGDIKRRINQRKKQACGAIEPDVEVCKQHYQWLRRLQQEIKRDGIPSWLS